MMEDSNESSDCSDIIVKDEIGSCEDVVICQDPKVVDGNISNDLIPPFLKASPLLSKLSKKFICEQCNKCFYLKNNLQSHMLEHKPSKNNSNDSNLIKKTSYKDNIPSVLKLKTPMLKTHNSTRASPPLKDGKASLVQKAKKRVLKNQDSAQKKSIKNSKSILNSKAKSKKTKPISLKRVYENIVCTSANKWKNKEFFCDLCNKNFRERKSLKIHVQKHAMREKFKCDECGVGFYSQERLDKHIAKHSLAKAKEERQKIKENKIPYKKRPIQCEICDKTVCAAAFKSHMHTHTGERPYKCKQCDATFVQSHHLKRHMIKHWDEEAKSEYYAKLKAVSKDFLCELCGKAFRYKFTMNQHYRNHFKNGQADPQFGVRKRNGKCNLKCPACPEVLTSLSEFNRHKMYHHPEILPSCQFCSQKFSYSKLLFKHYLKHSKEELSMLDEDMQKEIERSMEEPKKIFKCDHCDKTFRHEKGLQSHVRHHTGERPFICSICGKTFVQDAHLKTHMALHSGEKPYICSVCGKGFAVQNYLYNHEKIHSANGTSSSQSRKMFGCHCGKEFATHRSHIRHQKSCTPTIESLLEIDTGMETNPGRWVGISILTSEQN